MDFFFLSFFLQNTGEIDHHKLFVWEASSGKLLRAVSNHWPTVHKHLGVVSLASHPGRVRFATCAMDGTICMWCQPARQDWSVYMQEYENVDQNEVAVVEEVEVVEVEVEVVEVEEVAVMDKVAEGNSSRRQTNRGAKRRKKEISSPTKQQEQREMSTTVNVVTGQHHAKIFFIRADPPEMDQTE